MFSLCVSSFMTQRNLTFLYGKDLLVVLMSTQYKTATAFCNFSETFQEIVYDLLITVQPFLKK